MAHPTQVDTASPSLVFSRPRVAELLEALERIASGDTERRLPISPLHDELDAIAHAVNVLVGELRWTATRAFSALEARAGELREAAARAERANESKSVFLRNVNHEIRTPIAAMLGFADLLASAELSAEDRADLVRGLRTNGEAVLALLGDLLDLARLDADKVALTPESVSLLDLVREVQATLALEIRGRGLALQIQLSSEALTPLRTDRHRVRQILVNLIGNAVKFTHAGSIVVSLQTESARGEDLRIIDVSDTGIGIPPDRHATLFEPFEQGHESITRTYGGSGLGLAVSRRLAERLGGTLVLLRSVPGEGTTFRLTLKPLPGAAASLAGGGAIDGAAPDDLEGLRVLLAEDHPDIQRSLERLLGAAGATVDLARDGVEAVTKAKSGAYDVLLMDVHMPYVNGLEATRALRDDGCAIAIVALTADTSKKTRSEALAAGCDACLSKPFTMSELTSKIEAAQARRREARADPVPLPSGTDSTTSRQVPR